jgi:hypothetical protein
MLLTLVIMMLVMLLLLLLVGLGWLKNLIYQMACNAQRARY